MHTERGHVVGTAVEARGGFLGRPVLAVLIVSIASTVVILALVYTGFFTL
jgi:hypothetical protein